MRYRYAIFFMAMVTALLNRPAAALNQGTHGIINQQAGTSSSLEAFLKNQVGLEQGSEESLLNRTVVEWLNEGGHREDDGSLFRGTARFFRHFHDPLKTWDQSGLDLPFLDPYESSVRWMQRLNQQAQTPRTGNWAWQDARDYYFEALTAPMASRREERLADTFRALGQVMHLIVDASVPEHVRNDAHPLGLLYGNYEYWVEAQHGTPQSPAETAFIQAYLSNPVGFDPAILGQGTGDAVARLPVARLIDTDTYSGLNPNVTLTAAIGIAEFANANFFSEDTGERKLGSRNYPFPSKEALQPSQHPAPLTGRARAYYRKGHGDGLPVDPALAECVLDEAAARAGIPPTKKCTDERVWAQTAAAMLPRAVGYARGALDYFFRGRLAATLDVWKDGTGLHARVQITNAGDEDMSGTFGVYYDLPDGTRTPLASWPLALAARQTSDSLVISPLRPDVPPTPWMLVFRGTLGPEPDRAVVVTRIARHYLGVLSFFSDDFTGFESAYSAFFSFPTDPDPLPLTAVDMVVRIVAGSEAGIAPPVTQKSKYYLLLYANPPVGTRGLEATAVFDMCWMWDRIVYRKPRYPVSGGDVVYPAYPAGAVLLKFEPPPDLVTLFSYTYLRGPAAPSVIAVEPPVGGEPITVELRGPALLALRLASETPDPGLPDVPNLDGWPQVTRTLPCLASVNVRFLE